MEKKYNALRIIGTIYKVLGIITGLITILLVLAVCVTSVLGGAAIDQLGQSFGGSHGAGGIFSGLLGGLIFSVVGILYGGGLAITLYAMGEGVYLLLALEENTRETALLLRERSDK